MLVDSFNKQYNFDFGISIQEPKVWMKKVHSREVFSNVETEVKLLVLANLHEQYLDIQDVGFQKLAQEILGSPPYRVEVFDNWWELLQLENSPYYFEHYEESITSETMRLLAETGIYGVDRWLKETIEKKSQQK